MHTAKTLPLPLLALLLSACTSSKETVLSGNVFGTPYEVRVVTKSDVKDSVRALVETTFKEAEAVLSATDPTSELSRFNQSEKLTWLPASRSLVTVVEEALRVSKATDGAWDVTAGKLTDLYRGGKKPGPVTLAAAKQKVGYFHLEARQEPLALKKSRRGFTVDLSSLAPGFVVDTVADGLRRKGYSAFRIQVGDVTRAAGVNAAGESWPYRFSKPVAVSQAPAHLTAEVISLDDRAASTTSLAEGGNQAAPLVDARSGEPVNSDLVGVTVLDLSALRAQAYATGLFFVGRAAAMDIARKQGLAAYLVSRQADQAVAEATPLFPQALRRTY